MPYTSRNANKPLKTWEKLMIGLMGATLIFGTPAVVWFILSQPPAQEVGE